MRRPPFAVTAVLLAGALGLAACSGDGDGAAGGSAGTTTSVGGEGATTTLPVTVTGAVDLRRLVVEDAPAGYGLLASPPFGAVDLQRLLTDFSDAPMQDRVILEEARFKAGYTRGWLREDPRSFLGLFVFEFDDDAGARSAREQFAAQDVGKKNISPFAVDGIAGATGESYTRGAEGQPVERVHTVTFVRGPRLYQVDGVFAGEQDHLDEIVAFAKTEDRVAA